MLVRRLRRHGLPVLSATRAAMGVSMLARPELLAKALGADSTTAARLSWLTRMVGAREVALGAGTLLALRRGKDAEEWAYAQLLSDAADALAVGAALARGHVRAVPGAAVVAAAASGVATGVLALRGNDDA